MSKFADAMLRVFEREGRFDNDPDDPGGMTCWGISRRANPKWPGWEVVDKALAAGEDLALHDVTLKVMAGDLYEAKYWLPAGCAMIEDQRLAEYVFDIAVNHGVSVAQDIWGQAYLPLLPFGELTFLRLILRRIIRYINIVTAKPSQAKFLLGWIRRALYPLRKE